MSENVTASSYSNLSPSIFWGTCLGNLFEHYDTALFALLSPFLATLFFPLHDPVTALTMTYAIIPLGMLARPLGALVFGYIGDRYGREKALVSSLLGMSVVTASMAMLPTYLQAGILAPIALSILRICQNFFAAGELIGGAIHLLENTEEKSRNVISSLYSSSTIAGILLASAGVSLLNHLELIDSHWRLLYLFGSLTACFGWILRSHKMKSIDLPYKNKNLNFSLIIKQLWEMRSAVVTIAFAAGFSYSSYMIALVVMNGFVPLVSDVTKAEVSYMNTFLLILDFLTLPLFGYLSSKWSKKNLMVIASLLAVLTGVPLFTMLENATFEMVIAVRIALVLIGVCFSATFHAWSQELVPKSIRYTVVGLSYAFGSQLFGGPTAAISLWLFQKTGIISSVCWYWIILGGISTVLMLNRKGSAAVLSRSAT